MKKKEKNTTGNNANTVLPPVVSLKYSFKLKRKNVFEKHSCRLCYSKRNHCSIYDLVDDCIGIRYEAPTKTEIFVEMEKRGMEVLPEYNYQTPDYLAELLLQYLKDNRR